MSYRFCEFKSFNLKHFKEYGSAATRINFEYRRQFHKFATRLRAYGIFEAWRQQKHFKIDAIEDQEIADIMFENVSLIFGGLFVFALIAAIMFSIELLLFKK